MTFLHKTALASALVASLTTVQAADTPPSSFSFSGNVALTSDYVFRGMTQTDEESAIQGGFDVEHNSGLSAGIWGSNVKFLEDHTVDPHDRADHEIDLYIGFSNELDNGFSYGITALYFMYPGAHKDLNYDFAEFNFSTGYKLPIGTTFGLSYDYSPEFFGEAGEAHHALFNIGHSLDNGWGFSVYIARQIIEINENYSDNYTYYGVSISYSINDFELAVNVSDTDLEASEGFADERVFVTISKSF